MKTFIRGQIVGASNFKILEYLIEMFLEHQIVKFEWFLKDRVTLKTGVKAAENYMKSFYQAPMFSCFTLIV